MFPLPYGRGSATYLVAATGLPLNEPILSAGSTARPEDSPEPAANRYATTSLMTLP